MRRSLAFACAWAALAGCKKETCEEAPPGFRLEVATPSAAQVKALQVRLEYAEQILSKRFEVGTTLLDDGRTTLAVTLEPPPAAGARMNLLVRAEDAGGNVLAAGSTSVDVVPNGCNEVVLMLAAAGPMDGGVDAGGVDAEPTDQGGVDAPAPDAPAPDAPTGDAEPDAGVTDAPPGDVPFQPDAEPDAGQADAPAPDAPAPDSGLPFTPSNFDPALITNIAADVTIDCSVVFDSDNLTFDQRCIGGDWPVGQAITQLTGEPAAVLAMTNLEVSGTLWVVGSRPVIIYATGDVTVSGFIDASSNSTRRGAGASDPQACQGATGNNGTGTGGGEGPGGGSGGSFGGPGGAGGDNAEGARGARASTPISAADLTPLRGGCSGGDGGAGQGGSVAGAGQGGGAVQVTSLGSLSITTSGRIRASGQGGEGAGRRGGGGGGGSGGGILLETSTFEIRSGAGFNGGVGANGGGGGGGGRDSQTGLTGGTGDDGATIGQRAGGGGGAGAGGAGGPGSFDMLPGDDGNDATAAEAGGGGGGGGAGIIRVRALSCTLPTSGLYFSPPATITGC